MGPSVLAALIEDTPSNSPIHITFDNFYSDLPMMKFLSSKEIKFTCIWNPNKTSFPAELKNKKIAKGKFESYMYEGIRFLLYNQKGNVYLASNLFTNLLVK